MLPMLVTLIAMWLAVMRQPDTPIARTVWRLTVTAPIAWASRVQRRHLLLALILSIIALAVVYWIGREGAQILAMGAPDIGAWLVAFEVSTYVDALAAVAVAASALRVKSALAKSMTWVSLGRTVPMIRRSKTRRRTMHAMMASNDDDERRAHAA